MNNIWWKRRFKSDWGLIYLNQKPFNISFKLSIYKCTNSVRSTINMKAVLHESVNGKIKVWKGIWWSGCYFRCCYIERVMLVWFPNKFLHWIPVLPSSSPGNPTTPMSRPTQDPAGKKNKLKKEKLNLKKMEWESYLCVSSLGGWACWRAFSGKRLVRRGLQQQNILGWLNSVKIMYARNI